MKRHWKTYLLGILALTLCGCAKNDVMKPDPAELTVHQEPISFTGCYVDNAATRHSNALCEHLPTMGVWGWRNGMWDNNTLVFNDQYVSYNADSTRWEYTPLQYWRKGSQYTFCAYAPHQFQTQAEVSIDSATRMISIKGVSLHGHNLQSTPTTAVKELFRGTPDTDWMISRAGQTATGAAGIDVQFNMQHILAKLNIRIKACEILLQRPHIAAITADSITVDALASKGNFVQQLTHTPIISNTQEAATEEWTAHTPNLSIKGTHPHAVTAEPLYLIESLVIPQHLSQEATITLYYTYYFKDGNSEQCRFHMPVTDAFTRFVSGYNHTLTFTICSKRIEFEAGAADWEEKE